MLTDEIKKLGVDPELLSQAIKDYLEIYETYNNGLIKYFDPVKYCKNEIAAQQLKLLILFLKK
ncbi:MAG: hypothetical protein ACK48F_10895 [Chryseotalea sp.]|jgi:hypothetical protein